MRRGKTTIMTRIRHESILSTVVAESFPIGGTISLCAYGLFFLSWFFLLLRLHGPVPRQTAVRPRPPRQPVIKQALAGLAARPPRARRPLPGAAPVRADRYSTRTADSSSMQAQTHHRYLPTPLVPPQHPKPPRKNFPSTSSGWSTIQAVCNQPSRKCAMA